MVLAATEEANGQAVPCVACMPPRCTTYEGHIHMLGARGPACRPEADQRPQPYRIWFPATVCNAAGSADVWALCRPPHVT